MHWCRWRYRKLSLSSHALTRCAAAFLLLSCLAAARPALAAYTVTSFDESHYPTNPENGYGGFAWGDFDAPGAVTNSASSLALDIFDRDSLNNVSGGIGVDYPIHNFDSSLAQWEIRYRVLPNNTATSFRTVYIDDDGPGTVNPRRATEYDYDYDIAGVTPAQGWQTITKPFNSFAYSGTAFGSDAGDGIQNPGLSQLQLQSVYNSTGRLNVEVDYVKVNSSADPPPPYPGAEADAPWRAVAAAKIDTLRKADLHVTVTDALGNPLPNATVGVHMLKHEFGFGSAVQADRLASTDPAQDIYKQKIQQLFNIATIENHMKWQPWAGDWGAGFTQAQAMAAVNWLNGRGVAVRGHNMVWPGKSNLPQSVDNLLNQAPLNAAQQQQLRNMIAAHIQDIGSRFAGQLSAWDVVNEPRANHDVMDNLPEGNAAMADWYKQAHQVDPHAKLYLNDYDIIESGGDTNSYNQQLLYSQLQTLKNQGAPIGGIGFQGHFNQSNITGPEQLWAIWNHFKQLGLNMQVTEFDFNSTDEALQAQYTRDVMTAAFAQDGISDFLSWGFWEGADWLPNAAMFRNDWSIKPNGQAFLDLVYHDWWTNTELAADATGQATIRAFKGDHNVSGSFGGFTSTLATTLTTGGKLQQIALPFVLGDYNHNGMVDAADYTVWRDTFGRAVTVGVGADGNGDGLIDAEDFNVWRQHFGQKLLAGSASNIPEPSSLLLIVLGSVPFINSAIRIRRPKSNRG
jgi:GH35 family endo-1,4-beta-xylanase